MAQSVGARPGPVQDVIAAGEDDAEQLVGQRRAQAVQGVAVVVQQLGVTGRVEGVQPGVAGPGLEDLARPLQFGRVALAGPDERLAGLVVGPDS